MTMATLVGHRLFGRSTMTARFALTSARYTSATTTIPFPLLSATRSHTGSRLHSTAAASAADHPISPREPVDIRTQLLDAALVHVGSLGWTKDTLAAGARDLGLSPASHGIVSGGAVELVYHWMDKGNADLEAYLTDNAQLDTNDDTTAADYERQVLLKGLRHRLAYTKPVVWTWPQAMALGAEPHNLADTLARLSQISDLVCRFADDANTQGSGKQGAGLAKHPAAVGAAYAAAELYMLTDYSENFEDTWAFLERRIDDAGSVSQNASGLLSVLGAAATGAQAVASGVRSLDPTSAMPGNKI